MTPLVVPAEKKREKALENSTAQYIFTKTNPDDVEEEAVDGCGGHHFPAGVLRLRQPGARVAELPPHVVEGGGRDVSGNLDEFALEALQLLPLNGVNRFSR